MWRLAAAVHQGQASPRTHPCTFAGARAHGHIGHIACITRTIHIPQELSWAITKMYRHVYGHVCRHVCRHVCGGRAVIGDRKEGGRIRCRDNDWYVCERLSVQE